MIPIMPMLQAIQQLQWIGLAKKEDAKEDASKDGMEALMTKKFSLNNWPWLELPFDIYQPLVVNICRPGQDLDCIPRRCQGRCPQRWNGMPNRPTHLSKGFGIPYWSFWCTIHQPTAHSSRDIQVNQNIQKEATNDPLSEAIAKELANRSKNQ